MSSISTLGQTLSQIAQINTSQVALEDLSRQIATGRRADTFAGFGDDVVSVQRLRADIRELDGFLSNISILEPRIEITQNIYEESIVQVDNILDAFPLEALQSQNFDPTSLNDFAGEALDLVQGFLNTDLNGRFLLAGDAVSSPPYENPGILDSEIASLLPGLLDGTRTSEEFLDAVSNLSDTELGFSASVQAADGVFARVDRNVEIDYTARANGEAFKNVLGGLAALSQISFPQEGVDAGTQDTFFNVLDGLRNQVREGVEGLRSEFNALERDRVVIDDTRQKLTAELGLFLSESENLEAVDPAEAIVTFQSLQTQLEASFQVTSIIANTSLINFI